MADILKLRIPPSSPRLVHHFVDGRKFERAKGWYDIDTKERDRFERALISDMNPQSGPLFQIVTPERALAIDIEEGRAGATTEKKQAQRDAEMQAKIDTLGATVAKQSEALERQGKALAEALVLLARIASPGELALTELGRPSAVERRSSKAQETTAEVETTAEAETKSDATAEVGRVDLDTNTEQKEPPEELAARPTRPGSKSSGARKSAKSGEAKVDEPTNSVAAGGFTSQDPLGSADAAASYDEAVQQLRS